MKYIKLFESVNKDYIDSVTQTIEDILLDIEDDYLHNHVFYRTNRDFPDRLNYSKYKVVNLYTPFKCVVYIKGKYRGNTTLSETYKYSEVKSTVERIEQYLKSEGIYKETYFDDGSPDGWQILNDSLSPNTTIFSIVINYDL